MAWLIFFISAIFVVGSGWVLVRCSDVIAEETKLGRVWVGSILLAGATSLPELMTNINAGWRGAADIIVGNVLGSNLCNMAVLGLTDLSRWSGSVLAQASPHHLFTASLGTFLTALVGAFLAIRLPFQIGRVGIDTTALLLGFLIGSYLLRHLSHPEDLSAPPPVTKKGALWKAIICFLISATVLFIATSFLVDSAQIIAKITGLGETFVGTTMVALATSLPELSSSVIAAMMGRYDLAVGNMFGSNAFNMTLLFFGDMAFRGGAILRVASRDHIITAFFAVALMMVGAMGIAYRKERKRWWQRLDGFLLVVLYILVVFILWQQGRRVG